LKFGLVLEEFFPPLATHFSAGSFYKIGILSHLKKDILYPGLTLLKIRSTHYPTSPFLPGGKEGVSLKNPPASLKNNPPLKRANSPKSQKTGLSLE